MMRRGLGEQGLEWDGLKTSEGLRLLLEELGRMGQWDGAGYLCNLAKTLAWELHGHERGSPGSAEAERLVQHALELDGLKADGAGFNHPDDPDSLPGMIKEWNLFQRVKRTIWLLLMIPYLEAQGD